MQEEYESALEADDDLDEKSVELGELNLGKVAFGLVKNAKSEDFLEGNCKVAWDRLVSKYVLHTASSLQKLKSEFHNNKL